MNTILLFIIALCEVGRFLVGFKKQSKKQRFEQKLEVTQNMIEDLEFKIFKTKEIREDVRKEYSNAQARLSAIISSIENFKGEEGDKARIEDQKVLCERDISRYEAQMKELDLEVNGSKPTNDYPDGVTGIYHQIDSLRELQEMLKDWVKKC